MAPTAAHPNDGTIGVFLPPDVPDPEALHSHNIIDYMEIIYTGTADDMETLAAAGVTFTAEWCSVAAGAGNDNVLEWLLTNGCPSDNWIYRDAASNGHAHIIHTAHLHGVPWMSPGCEFGDDWAPVHASVFGHLDALQALVELGCPWNPMRCYNVALGHGNQHVADWIVQMANQ